LGVDLTRLAAKGQITEAILVAGDSDFLPAVAAAKDDGVLIRLFHGRFPRQDLRMTADERTQIDGALVEKVRRK
jgi:uncharacterized LabA/DUF88 family protein